MLFLGIHAKMHMGLSHKHLYRLAFLFVLILKHSVVLKRHLLFLQHTSHLDLTLWLCTPKGS